MRIPKRFNLHGQTITVRYADDLIHKEDRVGGAYYRDSIIKLQADSQSTPRSREQIEQNFCHELTHFILDQMGEPRLRSNEKFVDLFANLLHQALNTAEGEI